jgi:aminopeptidase N
LEREATQKEWLLLLRYETNGFAKWDVAQRLAQAVIIQCYHSSRETWQVDSALLDAYQDILTDETLDDALRAELLILPSFEVLASAIAKVDVVLLEDVRDFFRAALAHQLCDDAYALYNQLWKKEDHAMNGAAYGRRRLRQVCLSLLKRANHPQALSLCEEQFSLAKTMTDQLGSFALLVDSEDKRVRISAIERFYRQWQSNDLVLDKWFSIQAFSDLPDVLEHVKALLTHPDFQLTNPNKVRALIGAFCQGNPRYFHAIDGSGYAFLADKLLDLDGVNPQVAARLATPFTRWQRVDDARQALMLAQLERLAKADLSRDLREVVSKSLVK